MINKILYLLFLTTSISLTGCSLLKRDRVTKHSGIVHSDFNLPVFVYPAADSAKTRTLVVMLSGDGGWLDFEDAISLQFSKQGFNTIGFNSRDYFWERKTPRQTTEDLSRVLHIYIKKYKPQNIVLCGYSFGADVMPFIYNRLYPRIKRNVSAIAMMSPFATTDFMVHTSDLLNIAKDNRKYKVSTEIERIRIPIFCFYGKDESPKAQEGLLKPNFHLKLLPGDHRYENGAYREIINTVTKHPYQVY
jgi:type IV secretory pathway VirJ component